MKRILVLFSYTDGAHGNYGTFFRGINLPVGKALSVDGIFTAKREKRLSGLLGKYFRKR